MALPGTNSAQQVVVPSDMRNDGLGAGSGFNGANTPVSVRNKCPIGQVSAHVVFVGHGRISPAATYPAGQVSATSKACSGAATKPDGHSAAIAARKLNIMAKMKIVRCMLNKVVHNAIAKYGTAIAA